MHRKSLFFAAAILMASSVAACTEDAMFIQGECLDDSDCKRTDAPYCADGTCIDFNRDYECRKDSDCHDLDRPVCQKHHCIAVDEEGECRGDADCKDAARPMCLDSHCVERVECNFDSDCKDASKPVCMANHCVAKPDVPDVECDMDSDCKDASKPLCTANHCVAKPTEPTVECNFDSDCKDASKPVCTANHCVAKPAEPTVECNFDSDCKDASKPVCTANHCVAKPAEPTVECNVDSDCKDSSKPVCDNHFCVPKTQVAAGADILDVVFNPDGTAENIAPTSLKVQQYGAGSMSTTFTPEFNRTVVHFNNAIGESAKAYYRVDFGNDADVKSKIADGHSLEVVFRMGANNTGAKEVKPFAAHEGGGTGILLSSSSRDMAISFLPHVGGAYVWASSGIKPQRGRYYHVVGVWDKSKASIYVNGKLEKSVDATGDFKFGSQTWFAIGGDATDGSASNAWNGDIAVARVYSEPLKADRIQQLYKESNVDAVPVDVPFDITGVDAIGSARVSPGYRYYFYGTNFVEGDFVRFESLTTGQTFDAKSTVSADRITAIVPDKLVTDQYRSVLVRGTKTADLKQGKIVVSKNAPITTQPRVVAHMAGITFQTETYPANSIAALKRAQQANVYAVEIDLRISKDNIIFVTHNASVGGLDVTSSTAANLDKQKLKNGEKLPRFSEFLAEAKKKPTVRVLCDVKWAGDVDRLLKDGAALVHDLGMDDQVDWLVSYYPNTLKARQYASPTATVMHLAGGAKYDKPYATMIADGIVPDYDYNYTDVYKKSTIDAIHKAGSVVGVWTPDSKTLIQEAIDLGVDAVTTDIAGEMQKMVKIYVEP